MRIIKKLLKPIPNFLCSFTKPFINRNEAQKVYFHISKVQYTRCLGVKRHHQMHRLRKS